ncbi:MAG: PEGA domain-containing protein [Betaproteobacteria bacterium]|nr:MAG: PEGA domain-containing protein [Betaproteobacteria bacterium]
MMPERASRTFICSVLFLDIVEYSRKPVAEQIRLKDRFNGLIASAIREIPAADRIILDTGDGVAISFLGDPEDALFVAMSLRDAFAPDAIEPPEVPARIGINLGPVRLVRDLNGRPNIIGDGINVAQRVMGFAAAGQIMVSRSYFEIVSHISEGYTKLFTYEGSRTDKHVREHEIYSVGYSTAEAQLRSPAERARNVASEARSRTAAANATTARLLFHLEKWLGNRSLAYGTVAFSSLAFLLALLTSFVGEDPQAQETKQAESTRTQLTRAQIERQREAARNKPASKASDDVTQQKLGASEPTASKSAEAKSPDREVEEVAAEQTAAKPKRKKLRLSFFRPKRDEEPEPATESEVATLGTVDPTQLTDTANAAEADAQAEAQAPGTSPANTGPQITSWKTAGQQTAAAGGRAVVALAISPWGEVFVDGKPVGVSPPLNEVELVPGRRVIEIRNGNFPPYTQKVNLKAQQKIKIRYKFN